MRSIFIALITLVLPTTAFSLVEEYFGNEPLAAWKDRPLASVANHDSRVYHSWVNGAEDFYYRGDVEVLNEFLKRFAEGTTNGGKTAGEIILRPLPGETQPFHEKAIEYDWHMEIYGGISEPMSKADRGSEIWRPHPTVTIAVADPDRLKNLRIPDGLAVTGPAELKARYAKALGSSDTSVRGWGADKLSRFDPYDTTSMAVVAGLLGDKDAWVRLNAAGALRSFGSHAKPLVPLLAHTASAKTGAGSVEDAIADTIRQIENSTPEPEALRRYQEARAAIERYVSDRE